MKVPVFDATGAKKGDVELPPVFLTPLRPDVIQKAFNVARSNARQPYGASPMAGAMHSTKSAGKGKGLSRVPRIQGSGDAALAPPTVGGRRAHPPEARRVWAEKINQKERLMAIRSALAATRERGLVTQRGHQVPEKATLPVVLDDGCEKLAKTSDLRSLFEKIGLDLDLTRADLGRHQRPGVGKIRGRRYKTPKSVLVVARDARGLRRGASNLVGVDVVSVDQLNVRLLAPGGQAGRLTVFTQGALKALEAKR